MSLEQYYTEERIGERLVSMLPPISPQRCVELSAGEGALLLPIVRLWPGVRISTCELDPENIKKLASNFEGEHTILMFYLRISTLFLRVALRVLILLSVTPLFRGERSLNMMLPFLRNLIF